MSFPLEAAINGKRLPEEQVTQSMRDYVDRFQSRPAYIRALKKSPDYAYGTSDWISLTKLHKLPADSYITVAMPGPKQKL